MELAREANQECRRQKERFPLVRSYEQAHEMHAQARTDAEKVRG